MSGAQLWPRYAAPTDLAAIESIALAERGLPATTYEMLVRAAYAWPERVALSVLPDGQRWQHPTRRTFAELLTDVHRAANLLADLGIRRGDAVALIAPNCDELVTMTLAAQLAGVAAPINGALAGGHIGELVRRAGARLLVTASPELAEDATGLARELVGDGLIDTVVLLSPTGAPATTTPHIGDAAVHLLHEQAAGYTGDVFVGVAPSADDVAALFHTGGTTGAPKLAAHTHTNEVADAWMIAANSMLDAEAVLLAALPLFHVNALVVTTLAPLLRGQQTVWAGPLGYRDIALYGNFWKIVEHYRLTTMSAVPTVYSVLAQMPVDADISSLQFGVVGASALPKAVRVDFETHTGVPLVEGYGLTEATCATARSFTEYPRAGSVGQRMPYQNVKAVRIDDDGVWHDLPAGQVGTLVVGGPTVFAGYVVARDSSGYVLDGKGKLVDGWLDTGDLAWVDADGFIHLTGRAKDLIIRGGHNIDPAIVEDALLEHPEVAAAAAVGRPDVHAGEVPVAYVALRSGATVSADALRQWTTDRVAEPAAAPKEVLIVEEIPTTAVGKPYKLSLRADAARSAAHDAVAGLAGVSEVRGTIDDAIPVVTVSVTPGTNHAPIDAALSRYSLTYRITEGATE